jgi:hypothetical protein
VTKKLSVSLCRFSLRHFKSGLLLASKRTCTSSSILHYHITHNPRLEEDHLYPKQPSSRINHHLASAEHSTVHQQHTKQNRAQRIIINHDEQQQRGRRLWRRYNDEGLENPRQQGGHLVLSRHLRISPPIETYAIDVDDDEEDGLLVGPPLSHQETTIPSQARKTVTKSMIVV